MRTAPVYPPHIEQLKSYSPGLPMEDLARRIDMPLSHIVKLASNENPLGASPRALEALAASSIDLSRYPDNDCTDLTQELARQLDVPPDWVVTGAGSESVIGMATTALLSPGRFTLYAQYSFQAYVNAAQRAGATSVVVPSPDFTVDLDEMLHVGKDRAISLVYIANPGNPTGTSVDPDKLEALIAKQPDGTVVVLDEAYLEYLPPANRGDAVAWVRRHPHLLVTRTFSKAYGLAGLRVGYGIAQPALAGMLRRVRSPFQVSQPAQAGAMAALNDIDFLARTLAVNSEGHEQLCTAFSARGLRHLKSSTNFVSVQTGDSAALAGRLEQHGLIARPLGSYGLKNWLRVSIGTSIENSRFLDALAQELRPTA
ncbi:histidinol-phosphate transaminase [Variovorax sp. V213]|uniref:histidinol-phosphate transaminase n=1 Tax=Variovorax sp. V213 TaxID=3065955 RepID=UPI0034E848F1